MQRRTQAKAEAEAAIAAATAAFDAGAIDEAAWAGFVTDALAEAYLIDDDPIWQSGFDGSPAQWRQAREPILAAVDRDGSLLDVGCATGHLMECLNQWALERGCRLHVAGVDLSPALVRAARGRLPHLVDRIHHGHALTWRAPERYTYVRTGLEYVPESSQPALLRHLLETAVAPGGRLIVGPVSGPAVDSVRRAFLSAGLGAPDAATAVDAAGKARSVLWITRAQ